MSIHTGARHDPSSPVVSPPWPVQVDLHLHTSASDGTLSPSEVVFVASRSSLKVISITDHDTTAGLAEARQASDSADGLTLIPGVELSTYGHGSEIHLTCHFLDIENDTLQSTIRSLVEDREVRARQMVERLRELGISLSWEEVALKAKGTIGRPHIARAMMEAGYVGSVSQAFELYLADGRPGHVQRQKLDVFDAIEMVHRAGGVASVAHPRTVDGFAEMLGDLADAGLAAIEVYAEKYSADTVSYYGGMADRFGLIKSGGTDYHANGAPNEVLPGMNGPPPETALLLYERAVAMHGESGVGARFSLEDLGI